VLLFQFKLIPSIVDEYPELDSLTLAGVSNLNADPLQGNEIFCLRKTISISLIISLYATYASDLEEMRTFKCEDFSCCVCEGVV
jgi:hypothetical protein